MPLPVPEPGLVIRYDYLWSHEAAEGREQGKERPACLVAATDPAATPCFVIVLPITHTPPGGTTVGVEIPERVKRVLGLDDEPSWVIISEYNIDTWPNPGLTSVPGQPGNFSYGSIPPGLFAKIAERFVDLRRHQQTTGVRR